MKIHKIACGYKNTIILTECRQLFICGKNDRNQVANLPSNNVNEFYV